jgi:hypothetical protein
MKIIRKLAEWLTPKYKFKFCEDIPEVVVDKMIYIVGEKKNPWVIVFKCPCGCNQNIQLNLLKEANPCWSFRVTTKKEINIRPSVWRTTGCKSHFVVRNSKIDWVRDRRTYLTF